jgi:hypothetical protein
MKFATFETDVDNPIEVEAVRGKFAIRDTAVERPNVCEALLRMEIALLAPAEKPNEFAEVLVTATALETRDTMPRDAAAIRG